MHLVIISIILKNQNQIIYKNLVKNNQENLPYPFKVLKKFKIILMTSKSKNKKLFKI